MTAINKVHLANRYIWRCESFLSRVLVTCAEFPDAVDSIVVKANRAKAAAESAIYSILGTEPWSRPSMTQHSYRHSSKRPKLVWAGLDKGEDEKAYNLSVRIDVDIEHPGLLSFEVEGNWEYFLPKWMATYVPLSVLNEHTGSLIDEDFIKGYQTQADSFERGLILLREFITKAEEAELTSEHLLFLCPQIRAIMDDGADESFKRRPRKIKRILPPPVELKQILTILSTLKD